MKKKILLEDFLNLMTVLLSDFWYLEGYEWLYKHFALLMTPHSRVM